MAFARCGLLHHDIALKAMPPNNPDHTSLHHVAWGFDDIGHLKVFLDTMAGRGMEFEAASVTSLLTTTSTPTSGSSAEAASNSAPKWPSPKARPNALERLY